MNHKMSYEAELKYRGSQREKLLAMFQMDNRFDRLSPQKANALCDEVFHAIETARSVLIWSYPHAFYMKPRSTELQLFEHVQTEVERYLEQLTDMVENKPMLAPADFERYAKLLAANTDVLNRHVDHYSSR
jgi:uncharacterized protein YfkK (UPF0435 family)